MRHDDDFIMTLVVIGERKKNLCLMYVSNQCSFLVSILMRVLVEEHREWNPKKNYIIGM